MNLSLTPEIQKMIAQRMASGQYADANAVIGDALRRTEPEWDNEALRAFLAPRIAEAKRGEFVDQEFDDIFKEITSGN